MKKLSIVFISLITLTNAFATEHLRDNLTINTWHPVASERPHSVNYNGITRVYFSVQDSWGDSDCRNDAADILNADQALYSSMLAAFMSEKTVRVEVNDSLEKIDGVCKMTAAFIYK